MGHIRLHRLQWFHYPLTGFWKATLKGLARASQLSGTSRESSVLSRLVRIGRRVQTLGLKGKHRIVSRSPIGIGSLGRLIAIVFSQKPLYFPGSGCFMTYMALMVELPCIWDSQRRTYGA